MQEPVKVAINCSGGLVQAVVSNQPVEVFIFDEDNQEGDGYDSNDREAAWDKLKENIGAMETGDSLVKETWPGVEELTGTPPPSEEDDDPVL